MKKYILLLAAFFPYLAGVMLFNQPDAWQPNEHQDGSNMMLIIIAIVYLVCLLPIIISAKKLKKEEEDTKTYAVLILVIKLLQIPFHILYLILTTVIVIIATGIGGIGIIFIPAFVGIDYAVLAMTAIPTISCAIIAKKNNQISKGTMISVIISQFIFCIDVIGAILLLIKLPTKKSLVKLRTQNIEEAQVIPEIQEIPIEECNA